MQFYTILPSGHEAQAVPPTPNEVWKVTTIGSEIFYIDLTGAQFRFHKTVIPEKEFESTYTSKIIHHNDKSLGRCAHTLNQQDKAVKNDLRFSKGRLMMRDPKGAERGIATWKEEAKLSLPKLVFLPTNGFEKDGYRYNRELLRIHVEFNLKCGVDMSRKGVLVIDHPNRYECLSFLFLAL